MTPDETNSPDPNTPDSKSRHGRHRWERTVPQGGNWLKNAFLGEPDKSRRVAPRTRSLQIGAAVAAFGVLGVFTAAAGGQSPEPVQPSPQVHAAAEVAPLNPVPAAKPAPKPAPKQAPAEKREPVAKPAPAAKAVPQAEHKQAPKPKPKDQIGAWIQEATAIMVRNGIPREHIDAQAIRTIIMNESNGNPSATNNWDSNAAAGTPSIGLMQTIQPTFDSFALPGHQNIYAPVDNIIAATRYSIDRYGSVSDVPGVAGLNSGGSYQGY